MKNLSELKKMVGGNRMKNNDINSKKFSTIKSKMMFPMMTKSDINKKKK